MEPPITTSFQDFSFRNYHDNEQPIVRKQKIIKAKEVRLFIKGTLFFGLIHCPQRLISSEISKELKMQTTFHLAISNEKIKPNLSDQNHNWINCEKNFNKLTT